MTTIAYVALGSNLGDRRAMLRQALTWLGELSDVRIGLTSSIYETAPVGGPAGQGAYLNAVVQLETSLPPRSLLWHCLDIETRLGRIRTVRDGPRTIDLDLLFYGDQLIEEPELIVPHPRLHERLFVLIPLNEIAPGVVHPRLGQTVQQMHDRLLGVAAFGPSPGRELTGLRALVTGSTSGIGRAIAQELAWAGADVLVHGRRSLEQAELVRQAVQRQGGRSEVLLADLQDRSACAQLAENAWQCWDGLDILVNNAGADTLTGEAAKWSFEQKLDTLLAVDLKATMYLSRALGQLMKQAGRGVVINVGWDQAETGMEGDSGELFAAVKGAIMCFSRSLSLSLAPEVRVHCVAPGWIKTAWGETASEVWQERVKRETPLGGWGKPEDVAKSVRWLVSPTAAYLTGQTIRVNGGAVR